MSHTLPVTGNTEHTRPENKVIYPALDGLRAIAFLMVFGQHFLDLPWGWSGVNIFFVLSGFLITGILFDTRDSPHRTRNFYVRRTLRIFPLYYGVFLVLLLLTPLMHWQWSKGWLAWPLYLGNFLRFTWPRALSPGAPLEMASDAHLVSLHWPAISLNLGHFWSLCVEEQFYLFWPWVVWKQGRRSLLWICGLVVVLAPIVRVEAFRFIPAWKIAANITYSFTPFQLDSLLLGALLALLWRGAYRRQLLALGRITAILGLIATVLYFVYAFHTSPPGFENFIYPTWRITWGLTFINVLTAALILCCLQPANLVSRLLRQRPLRWLGRISYGAYVFHDILHNPDRDLAAHIRLPLVLHHQRVATAVIGLAVTLVLASLSFYLFESPFLNLKERLTLR